MKKSLKKIPKFKNEDSERDFWSTHDATEYFDITKAKSTSFPNLKPSRETISLRLPADLLNQIKIIAHERDIPYQSLMKHMLFEKVKENSKK